MKILYGVCGEGLGHAMRSAVVARHLEGAGHSVTFLSSGRAREHLERGFPRQVLPIVGLGSVTKNNVVVAGETLATNLIKQPLAWAANAPVIARALASRPDVVVSDFDPISARVAALSGCKLIAIDNIHFMNHCAHPTEFVACNRGAAALMYPVVQNVVPNAERYLITTFARAPVLRLRSSLHLPILRPEVLRAKQSTNRPHIVMYLNDKADHGQRVAVLKRLGVPVHVYGKKGQSRAERDQNVTLCPLSDEAFISDLASASAVIGGAGFALMTEAIYLGKPMLAVPFGGHFEQILNAEYLTMLGYGERCREFSVDVLRGFLERAPRYARTLASFEHDGNRSLLLAASQAIES